MTCGEIQPCGRRSASICGSGGKSILSNFLGAKRPMAGGMPEVLRRRGFIWAVATPCTSLVAVETLEGPPWNKQSAGAFPREFPSPSHFPPPAPGPAFSPAGRKNWKAKMGPPQGKKRETPPSSPPRFPERLRPSAPDRRPNASSCNPPRRKAHRALRPKIAICQIFS